MASINKNFFMMIDFEVNEDEQEVYALGTERGTLTIEKNLNDKYRSVTEQEFKAIVDDAIVCANKYGKVAPSFYDEEDQEDADGTLELSLGNDSYEVSIQLDRETFEEYPDDIKKLFADCQTLFNAS